MHSPKWQDYIPGVGGSVTVITLKEYAEFRFICQVLAHRLVPTAKELAISQSFRYKRSFAEVTRFYMFKRFDEQAIPVVEELRDAFELPRDGTGDRVEKGTLPDGRTLRHINFYDGGTKLDDTEVQSAISSPGLVWISGAAIVQEPRPDVSFEVWRDVTKKHTTSKPYFCDVTISYYARGPGEIPVVGGETTLLPKWWSLNEQEYAELREARKRKNAK